MKCDACGGAWHPASGDYDRRFDARTCGPCHRRFWDWLRKHAEIRKPGRRPMKSKNGKVRVPKWGTTGDFYAAAATSIRATEKS